MCCFSALGLRSLWPLGIYHIWYSFSVVSFFRHKQCACADGQELHRLAHELNAAAVPYVPAGFSGYGAQEQAAAQQSPVATIPAQVGFCNLTHLLVGCDKSHLQGVCAKSVWGLHDLKATKGVTCPESCCRTNVHVLHCHAYSIFSFLSVC